MKKHSARLTLGEKLKDLRVAKKLKLADVETATGISTSTLRRLETDDDMCDEGTKQPCASAQDEEKEVDSFEVLINTTAL